MGKCHLQARKNLRACICGATHYGILFYGRCCGAGSAFLSLIEVDNSNFTFFRPHQCGLGTFDEWKLRSPIVVAFR
jgi:hypothetical protein